MAGPTHAYVMLSMNGPRSQEFYLPPGHYKIAVRSVYIATDLEHCEDLSEDTPCHIVFSEDVKPQTYCQENHSPHNVIKTVLLQKRYTTFNSDLEFFQWKQNTAQRVYISFFDIVLEGYLDLPAHVMLEIIPVT